MVQALTSGRGAGSRGALAVVEPPPTDDVEPPPAVPVGVAGPIFGGFLTLGIALGGFGGWAALAPLASAVVGGGTVVVESNRRDIQHLDGGIVSEIPVREGQRVSAGDVLIRLVPTRAEAGLAIVRAQIDAGLALRARLRAEQDGADAVTFPPALTARAGVSEVADLISGQIGIFDSRRSSREGQIKILRQRIAQYQEQITGLRAQEQSRQQQIVLLEDELGGTRELADKGYAPRTKVLALERELARLSGDRGEHQAAMARIGQAIGEAELQILQIEKTFREEVARDLQEVQNRILELRERETAARDVVERLDLRAPTDGVVVDIAVSTVGAVIAPGKTVMQIVPVEDVLLIDAKLRPTDIDSVSVGQEAIIRFPAISSRFLPNLTGELSHVSADRLVDERTGEPFFKAKIVIDDESIETLGDNRLVPGMPAEVIIKIGDRTVLDYFVKPITDLLAHSMREP